MQKLKLRDHDQCRKKIFIQDSACINLPLIGGISLCRRERNSVIFCKIKYIGEMSLRDKLIFLVFLSPRWPRTPFKNKELLLLTRAADVQEDVPFSGLPVWINFITKLKFTISSKKFYLAPKIYPNWQP